MKSFSFCLETSLKSCCETSQTIPCEQMLQNCRRFHLSFEYTLKVKGRGGIKSYSIIYTPDLPQMIRYVCTFQSPDFTLLSAQCRFFVFDLTPTRKSRSMIWHKTNDIINGIDKRWKASLMVLIKAIYRQMELAVRELIVSDAKYHLKNGVSLDYVWNRGRKL